MKLIGVQFDIAWEDRAANFSKVRAMLRSHSPGRKTGVSSDCKGLIVLPEMLSTGFSMNLDRTLETDARETETFLAQLSREHGTYVVGGQSTRGPDGRGRNEAVVVGPGGNVVTRYAKLHPFSMGKEAEYFTGGDEIVTFRCFDARPDGSGPTVAPFVCYDLRFPEVFRLGMLRGAQVLVVIANWPVARVEHWTTLLRARAIENQAYVIGVNRCGKDPYLTYPGRSMIVDFRGNVLAEARDGEEVISTDVDLPALVKYRSELPFLADVRRRFLGDEKGKQ
jgi:predicted amidohydrolase